MYNNLSGFFIFIGVLIYFIKWLGSTRAWVESKNKIQKLKMFVRKNMKITKTQKCTAL
jgi:hypothetical protein